jgi:1,4-dihydroxy-2-naphthoate polyprenyltransferase
MEEPRKSALTSLIRISQPISLLGGLLMYSLGTGIAHYLGHPINWNIYWLGQACVTLLQLSCYYLKVTFDLPATPPATRMSSSGQPNQDDPLPFSRNNFVLITFTMLTIGAILTVLLISNGVVNQAAFLLLGIGFLISFFYAVPPVRLIYSGYGELSMAFFMVNLIPALALILQTGELHRLLAMTTFPLTMLYLAMTLALSLEGYASDLKMGRRTAMIRLGWQRGMTWHNVLILAAYFFIGIDLLLGLPWSIAWPALLTLPLGIYQIWQMVQIAGGAKPRWRLLALNAVATLGLMAYFLAFALWTH